MPAYRKVQPIVMRKNTMKALSPVDCMISFDIGLSMKGLRSLCEHHLRDEIYGRGTIETLILIKPLGARPQGISLRTKSEFQGHELENNEIGVCHSRWERTSLWPNCHTASRQSV